MNKIKFKKRYIIIAIIFLWFFSSMYNRKQNEIKLINKREELEVEISRLEKDIKKLNYEISISDSLEFVEKVARDEFGMVKPREIVYIDQNKNKPSDKESEEVKKNDVEKENP